MDSSSVKILIGVLILALYFGKAFFSNVKKHSAATARQTAPRFPKMQEINDIKEFKDSAEIKSSKGLKDFKDLRNSKVIEDSEPLMVSEPSPESESVIANDDLRRAIIWGEILQKKF